VSAVVEVLAICVREGGGSCPGHTVFGEIAFVAILGLVIVAAFFGWVQARWNRGPVAWLIRKRQRKLGG
jgi:hypothetical protein